MIEFQAAPGGDGESFCWFVTLQVFKEVSGREPDEWDYLGDGLYKLYMSQILTKMNYNGGELQISIRQAR